MATRVAKAGDALLCVLRDALHIRRPRDRATHGLTEAESAHAYGGPATDLSAVLSEASSIVALAAVSAGAILCAWGAGPWSAA